MEQKNPVVKKILNMLLEILSGAALFFPLFMLIQNSEPMRSFLFDVRKGQNFIRLTEHGEILGYFILMIIFPYVCWKAGKTIWQTENIAKGFGEALLIHLCLLAAIFFVYVLGPVD